MITDTEVLNHLNNHFPEIDFQISLSTGKIKLEFLGHETSFWLDDWINKNSIILAIIQSTLGKNKTIFARKCNIIKLDKQLTEKFLNENHLHGFKNAYHKIGLLFENELAAIATFSKGRKMDRLSSEKRSFELISFCCKKGYSVPGGLSKLIAHFIVTKQPGDIMTYIDKDWSIGSAYLSLGFKLKEQTPPLNYVFDIGKNIKYPANNIPAKILTEIKNKSEALKMVSNSGNFKLIYTPK